MITKDNLAALLNHFGFTKKGNVYKKAGWFKEHEYDIYLVGCMIVGFFCLVLFCLIRG